MPSYSVPSPDELPSAYERSVLPGQEDYVLKVLEIEQKTKPDFNGKPRDVFVVKFQVVSFADGAPLEDKDGRVLAADEEVWMWKDLDPSRMGFMRDGTASMARQFFLAINGISDLHERIPQGETEELVGKTVIATLLVKNGQDGTPKNGIVTFKTPSRRRTGGAAKATAATSTSTRGAATTVSPEYAAALGDLVGGAEVTEVASADLPF